MTDEEWCACTFPPEMLLHLRKTGRPSDRKVRLFACACVRCIWDLLDEPCREAVDLAEGFADGTVSSDTLEAARGRAIDSLDRRLPGFPHINVNCPSDLGLFLFPLFLQEKNWKERTDTDFERLWGYDPVALREETVIYRPFEAAIHCASSSTWGTLRTAGFGWCTMSACGRATLARAGVPGDDSSRWYATIASEYTSQTMLLRDIIGNPFRPVPLVEATYRAPVVCLATSVYERSSFERLPEQAAVLETAGCSDTDLLDHLRSPGPHVRGCWALDAVLGKE